MPNPALENFWLTENKAGKLSIVEMERNRRRESPLLNLHLNRLRSTRNVEDLLKPCAEIMGEITGLDRVMIYKFHDDNHGEVVAEHVREGVERFLGLHYPASDVPPPARAIFLENGVRMIPDVQYTSVFFDSSLSETLDLGRVFIRAVSSIHIQYLKNMNVGSSLTISIIVDDKLWGLIACHHLTSKADIQAY